MSLRMVIIKQPGNVCIRRVLWQPIIRSGTPGRLKLVKENYFDGNSVVVEILKWSANSKCKFYLRSSEINVWYDVVFSDQLTKCYKSADNVGEV